MADTPAIEMPPEAMAESAIAETDREETSASAVAWGDESGYTVILASETDRRVAEETLEQVRRDGLDAGLLFSSDYGSLRPGYWVVYAGRFEDAESATAEQRRLRDLGYHIAYSRMIAR